MESVGVRELRQNLSRYLAVVMQGVALRVLDRGRPVAVLAPLGGSAGSLEALLASGRLTSATLDLTALGPPEPAAVTVPISEALEEQRGELA